MIPEVWDTEKHFWVDVHETPPRPTFTPEYITDLGPALPSLPLLLLLIACALGQPYLRETVLTE